MELFSSVYRKANGGFLNPKKVHRRLVLHSSYILCDLSGDYMYAVYHVCSPCDRRPPHIVTANNCHELYGHLALTRGGSSL
jgi:hypothetical protein